jgi:sulfate adenylyltransferase
MISPHGGKLVNRVLSAKEKKQTLENIRDFKFLVLNKEEVQELKNIAKGLYSPISGFLRKRDFQSVVSEMHLQNGEVWSIPIVLDVSDEEYEILKNENTLFLYNKSREPVGLLENIEFHLNDKDFFAKNVYGTLDRKHPGVEGVYEMDNYLIGGDIKLLNDKKEIFPEYDFSPLETRQIFQERGWDSIVGFQTRNVPHRGHEFLQKQALKEVDGLFINPVISKKKTDDFKDEYILASYEILIDKYYPKNKVFLGILPFKMRYAGPREAIFHALVRKNFGCSHFIIGRDHAGIGNYYGPFDAQNIFDNFQKEEIGVNILKYPEVVYNPNRQKHVFINEYPDEEKVSFSGTKLRNKIKNKEQSPEYIIRPEVYNFLTTTLNSLVDNMYNQESKNQKGFVLWFTGLSQSGKTTVADGVYNALKERKFKVERLDGDIVREHLSKGLGFSKEDREENIKRVGFVSKLLSRSGVGVIASFISPYREIRKRLRNEIPSFIEVFTNAPLEVCERRDTKGLYKKARLGEIKNFTGISDPYESPENPEIELKTDNLLPNECVKKIIKYLEDNKYIGLPSDRVIKLGNSRYMIAEFQNMSKKAFDNRALWKKVYKWFKNTGI